MIVKLYTGNNYPDDAVHCYDGAAALLSHLFEESSSESTEIIHTTSLLFLNTRILDAGHKLIIVFPDGQETEIQLGCCSATCRVIRPEHSLLKLFLGGEFAAPINGSANQQ